MSLQDTKCRLTFLVHLFEARSTMAGETSDIVIMCAEDGREWAVFIQRKLSSPEYNIKTRTEDFEKVNLTALTSCKVQVVLLSPQLLEGVLGKADWDFAQFDKTSSVMILLGLSVPDIINHLGPSSECVLKCPHEVIHEEDPGGSLTNALVQIIKVYERDESFEDDPFGDDTDIYQYPPSPRQINQIYRIISPTEGSPSTETLVLLDRPADGDLIVELQSDVKVTAKFLDKAVYSLNIPDRVKGTVRAKFSSKEQAIGENSINIQTKLEQLHSLLQDITNPKSLMCQALGLDSDSSNELDTVLANQIQRQWSQQSMQIFQMFEPNITEEKSSHEWPTLPHFVAEFNLVKTCAQLLKFPSSVMVMACCTENCNGDYPCDIAERKGYHDLAELLTQVVKEHTLDSGVVSDLPPPPAPHMMALHYVNKKHHDEVEGFLDTESPYMDMSGLTKAMTSDCDDRPLPCKRPGRKDGSRMQRSVSEGESRKRISFMNPEFSTSSNGEDSPPEEAGGHKLSLLRPVSEGSADEMSSSPEAAADFKTSTKSPPPFVPPKKRPLTPPKPKTTPSAEASSSLSASFGPSSTFRHEVSSRPQTLPRTLAPPAQKNTHRQSDSDRRASAGSQEGAEDMGSPTVDAEDTKHVQKLYGNIMARSRSESEPAIRTLPRNVDFSNMSEEEEASARQEALEHPSTLIGDSYHPHGEPSLRGKTTRSRIASFLKRLTMKRQTSDPDIHQHDRGRKRTVFYGRQGRGSDPGLSGMSFANYSKAMGKNVMYQRKMSLPSVLEPLEGRDSGSYSEEDEGSTDAEKLSYRKKSGKLSASAKKQSLERKKSVRLSRALNENISDAPSMPPPKSSRSKSHSAT